jgi:hypothetical protein
MTNTEETPESKSIFRRHENFESWYANNAQFWASEFDLRMTFGELNVSGEKVEVQQHTAMTVSWLQAKLMLYYLSINIGLHELSHGKIPIPPSLLPPDPEPPTAEQLETDPNANNMYEFIKTARAQFFESLK